MTDYLARITARLAGIPIAGAPALLRRRPRARFEPLSGGAGPPGLEVAAPLTEGSTPAETASAKSGSVEPRSSTTGLLAGGPIAPGAAEPAAGRRDTSDIAGRERPAGPPMPRSPSMQPREPAPMAQEPPTHSTAPELLGESPVFPVAPRPDNGGQFPQPAVARPGTTSPDDPSGRNLAADRVAAEVGLGPTDPGAGQTEPHTEAEAAPLEPTDAVMRPDDDTPRAPDERPGTGFADGRHDPAPATTDRLSPEPLLSIGRIDIVFEAPEPPLFAPSRPTRERRRGFAGYERARLGLRR